MDKIKVLAINGSPKRDGNTANLLEKFAEEVKNLGANIEIIHLYEEDIPFHSGKLKQSLTELSKLQKLMKECDGFILATPTHWFNVSAKVKVFIDHLTDLEDDNRWMLEGKVGSFIVFAPEGGEAPVLQNLALTFNQMGVTIPPYSLNYYRGEMDKWFIEDLPNHAKSFFQQIKAQKEITFNWD